MRHCTSCCSTEGRTRELTSEELKAEGLTQDENFEICAECDSLDDTLVNYDEDYGQDR